MQFAQLQTLYWKSNTKLAWNEFTTFCFDPKIPIDAFTNFLTLKNVPYCVTLIQLTHELAFHIISLYLTNTHALCLCVCVLPVSVCIWSVYMCACSCAYEWTLHITIATSYDSSNFIDSNNKIRPYRSCQIVRQSSQHNNAKSCQLSSRNRKLTALEKKKNKNLYRARMEPQN